MRQSSPNSWNNVITILAELNEEQAYRDIKNTLCIDEERFKYDYMTGAGGSLFYDYICYFVRKNLMNCRIEAGHVYLDFKNDQVRLCLTKAGLILELKTYLICKSLVDSRGGDCMTSVTIDWDGDDDIASTVKYLYDDNDPDYTVDTTNEIDVLATCGLMPYFISCKNRRFTSEELYKLYSVGERFEKGYCEKIIVTTDLSYALGESKNIILRRAADMGIHIIENVHLKTDSEIAEEMKKVMELPKEKIHALFLKGGKIMYTPKPIDTSDVVLSEDLLNLTEKIASNVHDVWAVGRIAEGWTYGEKKDAELKTTPFLVPYDELPESEKDYDRNTAMETLRLIVKMGYKISKGE